MRRFIIFGLLSIGTLVILWWLWGTRRTPTVSPNINISTVMNVNALQSSAFPADGQIPKKYTCDGDNVSPPLTVGDLPSGVKYLAIILDDPEAVSGIFDHWVVWDIPAGSMIEENTSVGIAGKNSSGKTGYTGPCPPNGEHRYHFRVFGYAAPLGLPPGTTKNGLLLQLDGHALFSAELFGRYGANR